MDANITSRSIDVAEKNVLISIDLHNENEVAVILLCATPAYKAKCNECFFQIGSQCM
jgi:hypothetical protein